MSFPASFWRGATAGAVGAVIALCAVAGFFFGTGLPPVLHALAFGLAGALCLFLAALLVRGVASAARRLPVRFLVVLGASAVTLVVLRENAFRWPESLFYPAAALFVLAQAMLVGALWSFRKGEASGRSGILALALAALLVDAAGLRFLVAEGHDPYPFELPADESPPPPLSLENPAESGSYSFDLFHYGSGTDRRRPEFGEGVDWRSRTVDASKLLPEWKGFKARAREWYWGFSLKEAPINGRVWLPEGDGPFPLVLIVHGNHRMEEHSDPGYAYLGELLASRGLIAVSVDENYVNGTWSGDFGGKEMPARAWLLLEHLRQWREWNESPEHPVAGKVDLERIALVGHSRGGEAVAIAAAFNRLAYFPDDATVSFDYGFGIRALVAIAQIDRRYPRRMELENVSFLALQGSYDSDEVSFHGLRQFRRIDFSGDEYHFKAGIYLHGGNHGQFNTVWGRTDSGPPFSWLLNLAPIVPGDVQRMVARVYISAFLEATLHGERGYLPLFRDPRLGRNWLPDAVLVPQFSDSTTVPLASFEEDIDVTTATFENARIETGGLALWREEELLFRDEQKQGTSAVVIGWEDDENGAEPGSYAIRFGGEGLALDASDRLTFFASASKEEIPDGDEEDDNDPDLRIEIEDLAGETASMPLREIAPLATPLEVQFLKLARWNRIAHGPSWEPTLRSYEIPLQRFVARNPALDPGRLAAIRFVLDGSGGGVVLLDDVGLRRGSAPPEAPVEVGER